LGAVTHVDGTARVQTVSREDHPRFWRVIDAFRQRTGVPVLLNTSFNNNVEPIVDSVEDAITCFLTTGLQALVVGDFILTRKQGADRTSLVPELLNHVRLVERRQKQPDGTLADQCEIRRAVWNGEASRPLSAQLLALLRQTGTGASAGELAAAAGLNADAVMPTLEELWAERYLAMRPTEAARTQATVRAA
ncbi:carbamoyltransferase C-terminal domain-containing protein, partial [Xanthomonas maliensis]